MTTKHKEEETKKAAPANVDPDLANNTYHGRKAAREAKRKAVDAVQVKDLEGRLEHEALVAKHRARRNKQK